MAIASNVTVIGHKPLKCYIVIRPSGYSTTVQCNVKFLQIQIPCPRTSHRFNLRTWPLIETSSLQNQPFFPKIFRFFLPNNEFVTESKNIVVQDIWMYTEMRTSLWSHCRPGLPYTASIAPKHPWNVGAVVFITGDIWLSLDVDWGDSQNLAPAVCSSWW